MSAGAVQLVYDQLDHEPVSKLELVRRLGLRPGTISTALSRLKEQGLATNPHHGQWVRTRRSAWAGPPAHPTKGALG